MADHHVSWDDIRRDDLLLERVARGGPLDPADLDDPAAGPLLALARVGGEAPPALDPDVLLAAAEDRRGRRYAVRSLAVALTVVATLSTSGVAAVVTGDPFHPAKAVWQHLRGDSRVVAPDDGEILGSARVPGVGGHAEQARSGAGAAVHGTGDARLQDALLPGLPGQDDRTSPVGAAAPAGTGVTQDRSGGRHLSQAAQTDSGDAAAERPVPDTAEGGRSSRAERSAAGPAEDAESGEPEERAVPGTDPRTPPEGADEDGSGEQEAAEDDADGEDGAGGGAETGDEGGDGAGEGAGDSEDADPYADADPDAGDPNADDHPGAGAVEGLYPLLGAPAAPPAAPSALGSPASR